MLLPVVLTFSFMVIHGILGFFQSLTSIDIYEKELAQRYIADFHATECIQILARSFVVDPYTADDFGSGDLYPIWPADGDGFCTFSIERVEEYIGGARTIVIQLHSEVRGTDGDVATKKIRSYVIEMKFDRRILESILMKN